MAPGARPEHDDGHDGAPHAPDGPQPWVERGDREREGRPEREPDEGPEPVGPGRAHGRERGERHGELGRVAPPVGADEEAADEGEPGEHGPGRGGLRLRPGHSAGAGGGSAAVHAAPGPLTPSPMTAHASTRLAHDVRCSVARGDGLSSADLFGLAAVAFGGTLAEGAFTPRDAYDAAELGLHLHLLGTVGRLPAEPDAARNALAEVERLSALLPSQTRRTAEQNDYQQFSTPAAYAGLCAWVSGVGEGDRVLEPSAGTGALCTFALAAGASVHANELSGRRANLLSVLLEEAGQDPSQTLTRENADHLDAILPAPVRADVVTMNPPFSQTAGRMGRRRIPTVGDDHVLQALRRLDDGGRLVTVVSAAVTPGKPSHRPFYRAVQAGPFRLRANVVVDGAVYRPYGTSVQTRVLVIDRAEGGGGRAGEGPCVEGEVGSVGAAVDALARVRER